MGRLWAAKLAARTLATPGRVVRICPGVAASSWVIWPSVAAMSACRRWWRARSRPSRSARSSASSGGGSSRRQRSTQNRAVAVVSRPGARACRDRRVGGRPHRPARPGRSGRPGRGRGHARPGRTARGTAPGAGHATAAGGPCGRRPGHAGDGPLPTGHPPCRWRLAARRPGGPARPAPHRHDHRSWSGASRAGSWPPGLRRREQPHRPRPASFQLGHPGMAQPASCLHPDPGRAGHAAGRDQPSQGVDALAQHRERHRLPDQPTLPAGQPDPVADLAGIDRDHQRRRRDRLAQQLHHQPPPPHHIARDLPATGSPSQPSGSGAIS
jgi:hypothetical protein